jgi:UDP-glucuronate decarboxylase
MNILVTGAAGFLGSHLCKTLMDQGHSVIALDNLQTGQLNNLEPFLSNPNFQFFNQDIIQPLDFQVDQIFNFACPASPPLYQKDPIHTLKTSILGTLNCLELAKKTGARLLHASTSEVYGDPLVHPQPESYHGNVNPCGPRACYDEGKRAAEALCFDFLRIHQTPIRVIRIFNTYGPNMHPQDGRVVSNFINQALTNSPITLYGDGSQTRSFCYVSDLIDGILLAMNHPTFTGPVNLGNPNEFTVHQLAQKILHITQSSSQLIFEPIPHDDPKQRRPDISLANQHLNWAPQIQLEEGLSHTINYFQSLLSIK